MTGVYKYRFRQRTSVGPPPEQSIAPSEANTCQRHNPNHCHDDGDDVIPLPPQANVDITVFEPDGVTRATNATVTLGTVSSDTDANGAVWESAGSGDRFFSASGFVDVNSPPPRLNNFGLFRMGTNGRRLFMDVPLNQTETNEVQSGELILRSTTHTFGFNSTFGGTGTLPLQSPITRIAAVNFVTLNVVFESGASVSDAFMLSNGAGGTITFSDTMSFPGSMTIAGRLTVGRVSLPAMASRRRPLTRRITKTSRREATSAEVFGVNSYVSAKAAAGSRRHSTVTRPSGSVSCATEVNYLVELTGKNMRNEWTT